MDTTEGCAAIHCRDFVETGELIELLMGLQDLGADAHESDSTSAAVLQHDVVQLGSALVRDASQADTLSKLSRYETRLDRGLIRDLRELQRLQDARESLRGLTPHAESRQ